MEMKCLMTSAFTQLFGHSGHMNHNNCTSDNNNNNNTSNKKDAFECHKIKIANKEDYPYGFQVPLHYPKYSKFDYETMDELRLDLLLKQYGLSFEGTLDEKRAFAMGSFLWPDQL